MKKKVLVVYSTNAGSTTDVAETIGETLRQKEAQVDVCHIDKVDEVSAYEAVIVGGPMIMGWHKAVTRFLQKHQKALSEMPVAYFFTALHLTDTGKPSLGQSSIYLDPNVASTPKNQKRLSFKEKFTTVKSYLEPVLKEVPLIKPVSAGFFAGKLDYSKLNILHRIFVKLIIRAEKGDFRNWEAIRQWSSGLNL